MIFVTEVAKKMNFDNVQGGHDLVLPTNLLLMQRKDTHALIAPAITNQVHALAEQEKPAS